MKKVLQASGGVLNDEMFLGGCGLVSDSDSLQTRMGRVWLICLMSCTPPKLFLWWPGRVPPIRYRSLRRRNEREETE